MNIDDNKPRYITRRELETELDDLRKDLAQLGSLISEIFVQTGALNSKEIMNKEIMKIVHKNSKNSAKG